MGGAAAKAAMELRAAGAVADATVVAWAVARVAVVWVAAGRAAARAAAARAAARAVAAWAVAVGAWVEEMAVPAARAAAAAG